MMKKNVAILISKLADGGAERVASNLSLHLDDDKYNKYLIVYRDDKRDYPYGGELINLDCKAIHNPLGKIYNLFKRVYRLRKFKKEYKIDTTISLLSGANLVNILARCDDRVVVSVRNFLSSSSKGLYSGLHRFLSRLLYKRADRVIAVSELLKNDLIENFGLSTEKVKAIYNFYDIEQIKEMAGEELEEEYRHIFNKPTIINVGRLSKQKGQEQLLRSFKMVKEEINEVQLVILGKGELESYLKNLTDRLGLEDVHFLGFKSNPFKYIANSILYVFPSLYEGFPNALVEAMVCKIPVISADCRSGPREILAPDTDIYKSTNGIEYADYGILFPVGDGETLAETVCQLLRDRHVLNEYSQLSFERAKDFSISTILRRWENEL
ncbi:MAG TPA: glycosyltransferase [Halanaerobiales bacterium]|nr:glycosyltransferase [Halanaerobiales bacterium]